MMQKICTRVIGRRFCLLKNIIRDKNKQIDELQKYHGIEFEKHIKKLILSLNIGQNKINKLINNYIKLCLTSQKPIEKLLKQFLQHSKRFNQNQLTQTAIYLSKCYQMSLIDYGGIYDRFDYKLFQSEIWQHFIEEIKYGLSQKSYIQNKNVSKIIDSLNDMNYIDIEVIKLIIKKIQNKLSLPTQQRIQYQQRLFQAQKNKYYQQQYLKFNMDLQESEVFKKNIQYLQKKGIQIQNIIKLHNINQFDFQTKQNYLNVIALIKCFNHFNLSVDQIIQGIIAIRKQYYKMVQISKNSKVLKNTQLNYCLLQIQQKLLQSHLININDIKNIDMMLKTQYEQNRQQQIIKLFMSTLQLDNFEQFLVKQPDNEQKIRAFKYQELQHFCMIIQSLTKYVNLPYKLQGTNDKVSLINISWERYFIEHRCLDNNIRVQRIFRKAYVLCSIFIMRHLSVIEFYLRQSSFSTKIILYSALIEMGFYEQLNTQFRSLQISIDLLTKLNSKTFIKLIGILNTVVQFDYKLKKQLYQNIQNRIQQIINRQYQILNLSSLCNIINFLYQYHVVEKYNQHLYQQLIDILHREIQYVQHNQMVNKQIMKEGKRIIFFQNPEGGKYAGMLSQLQQIQRLDSKSSNPYLTALNQLFGMTSKSKTPYIITGVNDDNQLQGIYFVSSDNSSYSGDHVSGGIMAYCKRIYDEFNIKIIPISVNKFININQMITNSPIALNSQLKIQMKDTKQIINIILQYLPKTNQEIIKFIKIILDILKKYVLINNNNQLKAHKIINTLKKFISLHNQQKSIIMIGQFYIKRCQLIIQLQLLKKDINTYITEQKLIIQKMLQEQKKQKDINKCFNQLQNQLKINMNKILLALKQLQIKQNKNSAFLGFKGKRITLNVINQQKLKQKSLQIKKTVAVPHPEYQFINLTYLIDSRYVEYEDWKIKFKNTMNYHQIKLADGSELTRLLIMKFCPQVKQTIVAVPEDNIAVPFYPVNWQQKHYYHPPNAGQKNYLQSITSSYRKGYQNLYKAGNKIDKNMINLQNFKYQLKLNKNPKQIFQYIMNFQFITTLIQQKLQRKQQKLIPQFIQRNTLQYYNYLQKRYDKMYLQSPYFQYIFNKVQKIQQLKQLINSRKKLKIQLKIQYDQGEIDRKQFYKRLQKKDNQVIQQLKKLKTKNISYVNHSSILNQSSKIIQFHQDIDELQNIIINAVNYNKIQDPDYLATNGNYDEAFKLRRARLEDHLILIKILYNLSEKGMLAPNEVNYLKRWKLKAKQGKFLNTPLSTYTHMSIKNLSKKDKQQLKLLYSNMGQDCPNLSLNELIVELSNFIDDSMIFKLQSKLLINQYKIKLKINHDILKNSQNKTFKMLNFKLENSIFYHLSSLSHQDINCIIDMGKIFKTQGLSDREKYNLHYKDIKKNIQLINKCQYRTPLITQYLKQKDYQYYNNLYPQDIQKQKTQKLQKLWNEIFKKSEDECTTIQIKNVVSQLCKNMFLIKINTPPYFGNLVLAILKNNKCDTFTKQKLIAYLQLFKVPLQIDSLDLLSLAQSQQNKYDILMEQLRKQSQNNTISALFTRL